MLEVKLFDVRMLKGLARAVLAPPRRQPKSSLIHRSPTTASTSGMFFKDLVVKTFDQATGNHQSLRLTVGFEPGHFEDRVDGFLLRGANK